MENNARMSLEEFSQLSKEEIRRRCNDHIQQYSSSVTGAMEVAGYDFSWKEMSNVARSKGLQLGFFFPEQQESKMQDACTDTCSDTCTVASTDTHSVAGTDDRWLEIVMKSKRDKTRRCYYFDTCDVEKFDELTKSLIKTAEKSAVLSAIFKIGLDVLENAIRENRIKYSYQIQTLNGTDEDAPTDTYLMSEPLQ